MRAETFNGVSDTLPNNTDKPPSIIRKAPGINIPKTTPIVLNLLESFIPWKLRNVALQNTTRINR